jgi:hydrogenase maturation protease
MHIIGIGSPFGDDQAGWRVAEALKNRLPTEITVVQLDRPGSSLISILEDVDRVILIDAMQAGGNPGDMRHFSDDEWTDYRTGLSTHGLGVFEALMLARELDCLPVKLDLYGIEIGSASPGDLPSEAVLSAAGRLADRITSDWQLLK